MRFLCVAVLVIGSAVDAFAAAAVVQTFGGTRVNGTFTGSFGGNVTTGNAVICAVVHTSGLGSSYTISDATNGNYDVAIAQTGGSGVQDLVVQHKRNATGGFTNVTFTTTDGTTDFDYQCWEVSGLDASISVLTGTISEGVLTSHTCATSGLSGTGFAICLGQFGASTTVTAGSGWTLRTAGTNGQIIQDKIATFTTETGTYTTGTGVGTGGVLVLFREPAGGGGCGGTFCDDFNRGDNTDLGASWDAGYTAKNNLQIVSNKIRSTALATASVETTNTSLGNNQRAQITMSTFTGAGLGALVVSVRQAAPATQTNYTCTAFRNNTTTSEITEITAGAESTLASENATTWAAGDIIQCEVTGTTINFYRIVSGTPTLLLSTTDGSVASGRAGLATYVASGSVANVEGDDFVATDLSTTGAGRAMMLGIGR